MAPKAQSLTVTYTAFNASTGLRVTGDVLNHTLRWVKDGTSSAPANSAAEVDAVNAPGEYKLVLTAAECTCGFGTLTGFSSAANVQLVPLHVTFEPLPGRIVKNTALANFEFMLTDSADHVSPKTGLTVTAQRSIDGAVFGACANSVSELSNGVYLISLAASDLNGDVITLKFNATGADTRYVTIVTQTT